MTKIYCIFCALDIEFQNIVKHYNVDYRMQIGDKWQVAHCDKGKYLIVKSDIGKRSAEQCAEFIISRYREISFVVSAGLAGAISPVLEIGDIVIGNKIIDYSEDKRPQELTPINKKLVAIQGESVHIGKVICNDGIINDKVKKKALFEEHGALCVEMESAGVIMVCNKSNIPFAAVKVVSDHADGRAMISMMRTQHHVTETLGQFLTQEDHIQKITGESFSE